MTCQFENKINVKIHKKITAKEITKSMKNIDYFISGVGTGGTITCVGEVLKKRKNSNASIVAVEPWKASILSNKQVQSHGIRGIRCWFSSKNLNIKIIDYIFKARDHEVIEYARIMATTEGMAVGLSSGTAICAGIKLGKVINNPLIKKILIIVPSSAERYMSTELFDNKPQSLLELVALYGCSESEELKNSNEQQESIL